MAQDDLNDIEELLRIASSSPSTEKEIRKSSVDNYIKKFNIKAGTTKVPSRVIYYHYYMWKKKNRESRLWFFKAFSKHFEPCILKKERAYLLDPEPFDLSMEYNFKARALIRKQRNG